MREIKVKFIGFYAGFKDDDNIFINSLRKKHRVVLSDEPDYLFYSVFLPNDFDFAMYDCVRIFYSGENASPDFNYCDYAISFDEITYNDRYLRYPVFIDDDYAEKARHKHENVTAATYESKKRFCNFVVGNGDSMPERIELFNTVNNYKHVDSSGTFMNNTGFVTDTYEKKNALQRECRFSITCESVSQPGFVTEKILHAFAAQTIPIYYGDCHVTNIFNPAAFVNVHDYASFDEAVKAVDEIERNPEKWMRMMNRPAFVDQDYLEKMGGRLDAFLENIVSQEYEKAFRRPLKYHAARYTRAMKEYVTNRQSVRYQRFMRCRDNFFVRLALKIFGK